MKKILFLCVLGSIFRLLASDVQKLPVIKGELLKSKLNILLDASCVQILERKSIHGVVARAKGTFHRVDFQKKPGDLRFVRQFEKNTTRENIFITGLDHEKVTQKGYLFHKYVGVGERGLWVWRIGNVKLRLSKSRRGKETRLKLYTVDPKAAAAYYKQQEESSNAKLDCCGK